MSVCLSIYLSIIIIIIIIIITAAQRRGEDVDNWVWVVCNERIALDTGWVVKKGAGLWNCMRQSEHFRGGQSWKRT